MTTSRILALLAAAVTLLGSGLVYQSLARDSEELDAAVLRLPRVPLTIGDWEGSEVERKDGDERAFEHAGAKGYWTRNYVHQRTKATVLVILMCGRAGKMAVHTPEICYRGAGFELTEAPVSTVVKTPLGDDLGQFWTGQFAKPQAKTSLRLYWAWGAAGVWEASSNPRWQYRGDPYLYKLYVSHDRASRSSTTGPDAALEFLRQFLPEVHGTLFASLTTP
jgi:hypothetical protein